MSSLGADVPIVVAPEFAFDDGLNILSLALRRVIAGSSEFATRCAGCPDTVRFLSAAGMDDRNDAEGAELDASVITFSVDCSCWPLSCALVRREPMR